MQFSNTMTTVELPYDHPTLSRVTFPKKQLTGIYELSSFPPIENLDEEIRCALSNPIGTRRLKDLVYPDARIALIVDDLTRPTPVARILPAILSELHASGVGKEQITIVIALGSHRPMKKEEILEKIGRETADTYKVCQSRFDDPEHLVLVGKSDDGVDIYIDEEVARADIKIGVGSIVPHGAVGWSGGGKIIYPGVAGKSTVTQFHFTHGLTESNLTGLDETEIRTRMESWVDVVGLQFILNCVLTNDYRVAHVVAGHYVSAHREGVRFAHKIYVQQYLEPVDLVISVSHPHDHDFWQAAKGFYCAEPLVKDGGEILVATPCPEGVGVHRDYPCYIGRDDNAQTMREILRGERKMPRDPLPLAPAAMMAHMNKRFSMYIVSPGLSEIDMAPAKIGTFPSMQEGVDHLLVKKPGAKIAVILSAEICLKALG